MNIKDLALIGARVEMVNLKKRRLELLKMFPELDDEEKPTAQPKSGTLLDRVIEFMKSHEKPVSAGEVAAALGIKPNHASTALSKANQQKLVRKVRRGIFRIR